MSPKIGIELEPPLNGDFYSSNDIINGTVTIDFDKSLSVKEINVSLRGYMETMTRMDADFMFQQQGILGPGQDNRSYHKLLDLPVRVFPPDNVWDAIDGSSKPFKMKTGSYVYKFEFPKMPSKPACLKNHTKNLLTFNGRRPTMPPTFNNEWKKMNQFDNLDLYFYSFGKIIYIVQVDIELGKPKSWYKPLSRHLKEDKVIDYIPEPVYQNNKSNTNSRMVSANNSLNNSFTNVMDADQLIETENFNSTPVYFDDTEIFPSTYKIGLPDNESTMWLEIRSKELRSIHRMDMLFREGSGKFDRIFVVFQGNMDNIKRLQIVPVRAQLNLLERTTYLSQGVGNENFSSLKLMDVNLGRIFSNIDAGRQIIDFDELSLNTLTNKFELELKLKNDVGLRRLIFNEENYRHRGNRLYSIRSCAIERVFNFQLLIDWNINGMLKTTGVLIEPVEVFIHAKPQEANAVLPRYVEPPNYAEVVTKN